MGRDKTGNVKIGALLACLLTAFMAEPAASEVTASSAVAAIQQRICYEAFWWGGHKFEFGKTVTATIRRKDDIAFAWIDNLEKVPGASHWATFFTIFTKDNQTSVGASYGYNLDVMKGNPDYEQRRNEVFEGKTETVQLNVPSDCMPRFDPSTPEKNLITSRVEDSIKRELIMFNANGSHYPAHVSIIISNFDVNYPEIFVAIPSTGDVFSVELHDASSPLADTYIKEGAYRVQPIEDKASVSALTDKIRKYGIAREIHLPASRTIR